LFYEPEQSTCSLRRAYRTEGSFSSPSKALILLLVFSSGEHHENVFTVALAAALQARPSPGTYYNGMTEKRYIGVF